MIRTRATIAVAFWAMLITAASAAAPYQALIVTGQNGHDWKGTTPPLQKLLEDTGLFTVDVATSPAKGQDMSGFKPKFADYQLVVLNYQGDDWPEETKTAFVDYVKNGGGVLVFHFACAAFPKWKEYNEIIGLGGWGARNETAGPYLRLARRQVGARHDPGQGRRPRPATTLPDRHPRTESPGHEGPAGEVHAPRR